MRRLFAIAALTALGLLWPSLAPAQAPGVKPYVTYNQDRLEVFFRATELKPAIDQLLAKLPAGEVHKTDSQKVSVKNPRVSFRDGAISIRVDYSVATRGWTEVPAPTPTNPRRKVKTYTPWVTDSGWLEVDLRTQIADWVFYVHTRNAYVRWSSNNKFTNVVGPIFDNQLRQKVTDAVNDAIRGKLGQTPGYVGSRADLRQYLTQVAPAVIARQIGMTEQQVRTALEQTLARVQLNAKCQADGILFSVTVPRGSFGGAQGGQAGTAGMLMRTEFVMNSGGRFIQGAGGSWTEHGSNGTQHTFREISRTEASDVVLADASRKMFVILTASRGMWRRTPNEQWQTWPGSDGRWVK